MSIGLVAILHVGIVYALATGLAQQVVELLPQNINVNVIPPTEEKSEPPPPPPPTFKQPPPFVPPPDVTIDIASAPAPTTAITAQTAQRIDSPLRPSSRNTLYKSDYPQQSIINEEEGTVAVKILVLEDGRIGDVQLVKSSGYPRLDEKTISVIKSRWRYSAPVKDGKPIRYWQNARVIWRLESFGIKR
ncbi:MAG: energy transducer TonB [Alphaproteobacteria bacterium]